MDRIFNILHFFSVSIVVSGFNIDTAKWKTFTKADGGLFGYRVVQHDRDSLFVSAPTLQTKREERGMVYTCGIVSNHCDPFPIKVPNEAVNMSLGLTMTRNAQSTKTVVCGPTIPKSCKLITTYNGMCFALNADKSVEGPVPSALRDCKGQTDIAFLLDGSGSVSRRDFFTMKTFVKTIIQDFIERDTQFAIAQYSSECKIHLKFNTFATDSWRRNIDGIQQLGQGTYTADGIRVVMKEIFTRSAGARPSATRILLVITDGESHDRVDLKTVAASAEQVKIIRYAIGVGGAFSKPSALEELEMIASRPIKNHLFRVDTFAALEQIRKTLQDNIIAIEGTQTSGESSRMELAQDGFSAIHLSPMGSIVMGAVGAYQGKGGYQKYLSHGQSRPFQKGDMMDPDSYLGYSMAYAARERTLLIILGAPRSKHSGQVLIFRLDNDAKQQALVPKKPQIGSYYGAEVCVVDLDSDSWSDLLLVSAPMHTEDNHEGKVYVYYYSGLTAVYSDVTLVGMAGERGRFGSSLASLADLNGDGINDLAVGAPLENRAQGSVYIFNGQRNGINPTYSQRIEGSSVQPGLQFFGLSLSQSSSQQNMDGLPNLAVGSNGTVLLLRSRPVVLLMARVSYTLPQIPTKDPNCALHLENTLRLCFAMRGHNTQRQDLSANVNYSLILDSKRQSFRAFFTEKKRTLNSVITVGMKTKCQSHVFLIEPCSEDSVNPVSNKLEFVFEGLPISHSDTLRPMLLPETATSSYHDLHFEIDCGADNLCVDNLKMDFNFSGASAIEVGIMQEMSVVVSVENSGENSYNSHVILNYPPGLSYRRFTTHQGRAQCSSVDSEDTVTQGETKCFISQPIFRSNSKALFEITYGIGVDSNFEEMVTVNATAASANDRHSGDQWSKTKEIAVKYSINVALKRFEDSTPYINFTSGNNNLQQPIVQIFEVENFLREVNLNITIEVPIKLGEKYIWTDQNNMQIYGCKRKGEKAPVITDFVETLKKEHIVNCSVALCSVFTCGVNLKRNSIKFYKISGNISSEWIEQTGLKSATFELVSTASLEYDQNKYIYYSSASSNKPPISKIETAVEVFEKASILLPIAGAAGGLLLLALITFGLYKAGFFKSNLKGMLEEAGGGTATEGGAATEGPAPPDGE